MLNIARCRNDYQKQGNKLMDTTIITRHMEIVSKQYPDMNVTQLGMVCLYIGLIRAALGHEGGKATIDNYIHPEHLSSSVRQCLEYIEREVIALKKSKFDIDYWKRGNKGEFRRDNDKIEVKKHRT